MNNEFQIGVLVKSKAGRDENKIYLVSNLLKNNFCELVDGNTKNFKNPKKKNIKHLIPIGVKIDALANKITNNLKIYDAEVYSAIKKYKESEEN